MFNIQSSLHLDNSACFTGLSHQQRNLGMCIVSFWARGIEWLYAQTHVSIINILPRHLQSNAALDAISYAAIIDEQPPEILESVELLTKPGTMVVSHEQIKLHEYNKSVGLRENKELFGPIVGRPHPGSPGECKLAEVLKSDQELKDLFEF